MLTVRDLLIEHFLAWQSKCGEIKKQGEFAAYIGEDEKYLSLILNGRRASKRQVVVFADLFNDLRFYDAAGMDRPDPRLTDLRRAWGQVPEEEKKRIGEIVAPYIERGKDDTEPDR